MSWLLKLDFCRLSLYAAILAYVEQKIRNILLHYMYIHVEVNNRKYIRKEIKIIFLFSTLDLIYIYLIYNIVLI